jgi:hypothetical protein
MEVLVENRYKEKVNKGLEAITRITVWEALTKCWLGIMTWTHNLSEVRILKVWKELKKVKTNENISAQKSNV